MISCHLEWEWSKNWWTIQIPHEINNNFFWLIYSAIQEWKIKDIDIHILYSDFWKVVISPNKIDKLIEDYTILEKHIDKIIKIIPLPKTIWDFDGHYYKWFLVSLKQYEEIDGIKDFNKEDILYLIKLIKKKALEAKEKWKDLIFIWD